MTPAPIGSVDLPVVENRLVRDLIPDLTSTAGYVLDKDDGLAITSDGSAWGSYSYDGGDNHSGETMLWSFPET